MGNKILKERLHGNYRGYKFHIDLVEETENNNKKQYINGYIKLIDPEELPNDIIELGKEGKGISSYKISYDSMDKDGRWIGFTMYDEPEVSDSFSACKFVVNNVIEEISTFGMNVEKEAKNIKLKIYDINEGYALMYIDERVTNESNKDKELFVTSDGLVDVTIRGYVEMVDKINGATSIRHIGGLIATTNTMASQGRDYIRNFIRVSSKYDNTDERYNECVDKFSEAFDNLIKIIEERFNVKVSFDEEDYNAFQDVFLQNMEIEM